MSKVDHAPFERVKQRPPDDRWFRQEKKERKEKRKEEEHSLLRYCLLAGRKARNARRKESKKASRHPHRIAAMTANKHLTINDPHP
jgi:hypothetical protein